METVLIQVFLPIGQRLAGAFQDAAVREVAMACSWAFGKIKERFLRWFNQEEQPRENQQLTTTV